MISQEQKEHLLLLSWERRLSNFRALAEEAFFAGDSRAQLHYSGCMRQIEQCILDFKNAFEL